MSENEAAFTDKQRETCALRDRLVLYAWELTGGPLKLIAAAMRLSESAVSRILSQCGVDVPYSSNKGGRTHRELGPYERDYTLP